MIVILTWLGGGGKERGSRKGWETDGKVGEEEMVVK